MIDPKSTKKEAKKYLRGNKKRVIKVGNKASKQVDKHFIDRLQNLARSWRFVASWVLLGILMTWVLAVQARGLDTYYTDLRPRSGGAYSEGVVGPLTNMNPIYSSTAADQAVSRLLFSSLMRYDENNQLVGDLAESIEVDDKASIYILKLKPDLYWHDGAELTAQDVVFTVETIQNPAARSPLRRSLEGVAVEAVDANTVKFTLPASFSPFPNVLTFGILPRHILQQYSPVQLRSAPFNGSEPVGSGPFKFQRIVNVGGVELAERELKVQMVANKTYHLGEPRLEGFTVWVAPNAERLTEIFNEGQLTGALDLILDQVDSDKLEPLETTFKQTGGVFLFLKTTNPTLSDAALRRALTKSVNVSQVDRVLVSPAQALVGPLLAEQVSISEDLYQIQFNQEQANAELEALGWVLGPDGIRVKGDQRLSFSITTQIGVTNYANIVEELQAQYKQVGVEIVADYREADGFAETVLKDHVYDDMLLYGINIGADPDVYAFWHSSQADRNSTIRLNLSEYSSDAADEALEAGRSRVDPATRETKYLDFLRIWREDAPAIGLYRPNFSYFTLKNVRGPQGSILTDSSKRFRDVHLWTSLVERVRYYEDPEL